MRCIYDMRAEELVAWLEARGQPAYRAKQIMEGVYRRRATSFADLSNLPRSLREQLAAEFEVGGLPVLRRWDGKDSVKLLLALHGGEAVECVAMRTRWGETACLSSQVGCAMGCVFCASAIGGLKRNLSASELVRQVVSLFSIGAEVTNIVFMGTGEPLLNYGEVLAAIENFVAPDRMGISPRHVTVGTCGIVPAIKQLARDAPRRLELAVSLNAPTDDLRRQLMPGAAKWTIRELIEACDFWTETRGGQPVTYAYVLLRGVNDAPAHADKLARLLASRRHLVNLIRMNPVEGRQFLASSKAQALSFARRLSDQGIEVTLRRSLGRDIQAACGQLRRQAIEEEMDQAKHASPRGKGTARPA
ncbi:MAG: 23S rRNA (adenine(2503)-C(2))-methyltransferase RlmN [Armatimonadetes bacterium]|nr:23S rRNA (adenine(2503)-C(2))-methyltransferase RlmN [Armatimonadota bacterium]